MSLPKTCERYFHQAFKLAALRRVETLADGVRRPLIAKARQAIKAGQAVRLKRTYCPSVTQCLLARLAVASTGGKKKTVLVAHLLAMVLTSARGNFRSIRQVERELEEEGVVAYGMVAGLAASVMSELALKLSSIQDRPRLAPRLAPGAFPFERRSRERPSGNPPGPSRLRQ